jgi:hypothetical protein
MQADRNGTRGPFLPRLPSRPVWPCFARCSTGDQVLEWLPMGETVQALKLAIFQCEVSIENVEDALRAFGPRNRNRLLRAGFQLMFDDFRVGALTYALTHQN